MGDRGAKGISRQDALGLTSTSGDGRLLTSAEFSRLAEVPPEIEWFANIENLNTRRAYRNDLAQFMTFTGIRQPTEFRTVTRAHVIAWRKRLECQTLAPASVRRKLSAVAALFDFLCDQNAISHPSSTVDFRICLIINEI